MVGSTFECLPLSFTHMFRLLNYTPPAVVIRLLTTNGLIAYSTSWVLYLSGASSDPRHLLPAWISITTVGSQRYISDLHGVCLTLTSY